MIIDDDASFPFCLMFAQWYRQKMLQP